MSSSARIEAAASRSELVRGALEMAKRAHGAQIRNGSGGRPYIEHPIAVAETLAEHGYPDHVLAAALLHDVVEESDTGLDQIAAQFGESVGVLVGALTDAKEIEPYERRKDAHRDRVEDAGPNALAIYASDKLNNIRALRRVYATQGEVVGAQLKAPLEVKVAVWEADLRMLSRKAPELPLLGELKAQLAGLRAQRGAAQSAVGSPAHASQPPPT